MVVVVFMMFNLIDFDNVTLFVSIDFHRHVERVLLSTDNDRKMMNSLLLWIDKKESK